jgi:hypothetical protein
VDFLAGGDKYISLLVHSSCFSMFYFREWTTRRPPKNAALDPFPKPPRSTVSPSMSLLQGYYGLAPAPERDAADEVTELVTTNKGKNHH